MSALGQKQTFAAQKPMSALCRKRTYVRAGPVCYGFFLITSATVFCGDTSTI